MISAAQDRAGDYFISQVDKVVVSAQNEQGNVLYVLLDTHAKDTEAGTEIARLVINPSGFVIWATYELGYGDEFNAIFDGYIADVGIVHPTDYNSLSNLNPSQDAS